MANFNTATINESLSNIKNIFDTLKMPLGGQKSSQISTAIDTAKTELATSGLKEGDITRILQELDLEIDGVANNNIVDNFSKFKFGETLKAQIDSKIPSITANQN